MDAGHVLVTSMQGSLVTVVVQLFVAETVSPQRPLPDATTVSVNGPQAAGTVLVACQLAEPPTARSPIGTLISSAELPGVPLSSRTTTFVRGTLPQLVTIPLTT